MKQSISLILILIIWHSDAFALRESSASLSYRAKMKGQLLSESVWAVHKREAEKSTATVQEIWNDQKLSREITLKYERDFGLTPQYQLNNLPSSIWMNQLGSMQMSEELMIQKQQQFGDYVMRKLGEYQLDYWAKSNAAVRKASQIKDKVTQTKVAIQPGTEFSMQYSLGGQFFDFTLRSVVAEAHVIVSHSDLNDPVSLMLRKQFGKTVEFKSQVKINSQHSQSSVSYRANEANTFSAVYNVTRTLGQNDSSYLMGWSYRY